MDDINVQRSTEFKMKENTPKGSATLIQIHKLSARWTFYLPIVFHLHPLSDLLGAKPLHTKKITSIIPARNSKYESISCIKCSRVWHDKCLIHEVQVENETILKCNVAYHLKSNDMDSGHFSMESYHSTSNSVIDIFLFLQNFMVIYITYW